MRALTVLALLGVVVGCSSSGALATDADPTDARTIDAGGPDALDGAVACVAPPRTTACPDQSEPFSMACLDRTRDCDCPIPPDSTCTGRFPTEGLTPAARWVPGPFTDARAWAGAWVWSPTPGPRTRLLVTLHGTAGHASAELYWWAPRVQAIRDCLGVDLGIVAVQYHDESAPDDAGYLSIESTTGGEPDLERLVDTVLSAERDAGRAAPGGHLFHGFSRGSANMYPLAVLDGATGQRWGTRFIADAGAWPLGTPGPSPIADAVAARRTDALAGVSFYVFYGAQDHDPDRGATQRNAADVVRMLGGEATVVEDPTGCHAVMEMGAESDRAFAALLWALDAP